MEFKEFQLNKVRRMIKTQGRPFLVKRQEKNKFGEPNGEAEVFNISGVFHEVTSHLVKNGIDSSTVTSKTSPMFLCLWDDVKDLKYDDLIIFNNRTYKLGEIKNLCEANVVGDLSLEEVQISGEDQRV